MDSKRDRLETRVATLELMLVTERARPKPDNSELARLEGDLRDAKFCARERWDLSGFPRKKSRRPVSRLRRPSIFRNGK